MGVFDEEGEDDFQLSQEDLAKLDALSSPDANKGKPDKPSRGRGSKRGRGRGRGRKEANGEGPAAKKAPG